MSYGCGNARDRFGGSVRLMVMKVRSLAVLTALVLVAGGCARDAPVAPSTDDVVPPSSRTAPRSTGTSADRSTSVPTTHGSQVDPRFATLSEFAGDDPLGLVGDGWERVERRMVEFEFTRPLCPPQETYASFNGTPALVDTYRSPLADGVEVEVSLLEVIDATLRDELVVAALDELAECPLDETLGIDGGVSLLEQRYQGASGYYGSRRGFIVVAPDESDAALFAVLLEPRGESLPQAVVDHLVARTRALLVPSETATEPPTYLTEASIELGVDPLGLADRGWTLRWRDTEQLVVAELSNDCLEWTEFAPLDGTTYISDAMNNYTTNEWDLGVGFWNLARRDALTLVDGYDRLAWCPWVEDAARDADLFAVSSADPGWLLGGYFVEGGSAELAIAEPDGRVVTLHTWRVGLSDDDLDDLVAAARSYLDPSSSNVPVLRFEPIEPGVTSERLQALLPDPLGLIADGFDGSDAHATDVDLRGVPSSACDQLSELADLDRLPAIRGSYWTSEPTDLQVDVQIVDLDTEDAATRYWKAAPYITMCITGAMTGSSFDDVPFEYRSTAPDVRAFVTDDLNGWYSVIGPDGLVTTLEVDAAEGVDAATIDELINRARTTIAGTRIAAD